MKRTDFIVILVFLLIDSTANQQHLTQSGGGTYSVKTSVTVVIAILCRSWSALWPDHLRRAWRGGHAATKSIFSRSLIMDVFTLW